MGPDIHVKDGGFHLVMMFFGNDRLFDGIHAADRTAVFIRTVFGHVSGTCALDPGYLLGSLSVGGSQKISLKGTGGAEDPFKLDARNDI
jgi:hypothetical protein